MSKAILVIDMPKNCRECPLAKNESIVLEEAYNCLPKRKWVTDRECESRPNWCPLKEVPQKQENLPTNIYREGWNACIDEILKGSEENDGERSN